MFSLFPAFQSLSTSRRLLVLLPLPLAVAGALAWRQRRSPFSSCPHPGSAGRGTSHENAHEKPETGSAPA